MAKILITGGSGLIGKELTRLLLEKGHTVSWLSRAGSKIENGVTSYKWQPEKGEIDISAFENVDVLIHLAGASIAGKRWTGAYRKEIIESRVTTSQLLFDTIRKNNIKIGAFIGCSAVGYYGNNINDIHHKEEDAPGNDFLAKVCVQWEGSYTGFSSLGIRTCVVRMGVALSEKGGVYRELYSKFRKGLGAIPGSGSQYLPWIHIQDAAALFVFLVEQNISGTYNAVGDEQVNMSEFCRSLAGSYNKSVRLPNIPELALKLILGEASEMITKGVAVSNEKIKKVGFVFQFPKLELALKDLVTKTN